MCSDLFYSLSGFLHEAVLAPRWFNSSPHGQTGDESCLPPALLQLSCRWLGLSPEPGHGTVTPEAEKGPEPHLLNRCSSGRAVQDITIAIAYSKPVTLLKVKAKFGGVWGIPKGVALNGRLSLKYCCNIQMSFPFLVHSLQRHLHQRWLKAWMCLTALDKPQTQLHHRQAFVECGRPADGHLCLPCAVTHLSWLCAGWAPEIQHLLLLARGSLKLLTPISSILTATLNGTGLFVVFPQNKDGFFVLFFSVMPTLINWSLSPTCKLFCVGQSTVHAELLTNPMCMFCLPVKQTTNKYFSHDF